MNSVNTKKSPFALAKHVFFDKIGITWFDYVTNEYSLVAQW